MDLPVPLEMTRLEVMQRILAMRSGVPLRAIRTGNLDATQAELVARAGEAFAAEPFVVEDTPMDFVCKADLKRSGWTESLIHRLLGKPDAVQPKMHHAKGASMKLYRLDRVLRAETSATFARARGPSRASG